MVMKRYKDILKEYRESRGLTKVDLAKKIGVKSQYIGDIESGRTKPPTTERTRQIIEALKISERDAQKMMFLGMYERTSEESREMIDKLGGKVSEPQNEYIAAHSKTQKVPILGSAPAGLKNFTDDYVEDWIELPRDMTKDKNMYLIRANGDSMINSGINDKDLCIVDADAFPDKGEIAVVLIDHEWTIKKFYHYGSTIVLEPANPKYEKMEFDNQNDVKIRGVVRGVLWKGF